MNNNNTLKTAPSVRQTSVPPRRPRATILGRRAKQQELQQARKATARGVPVETQLYETQTAIMAEINKQKVLQAKMQRLRREADVCKDFEVARLSRKREKSMVRELELQIEIERQRSQQLLLRVAEANGMQQKQEQATSAVLTMPPQTKASRGSDRGATLVSNVHSSHHARQNITPRNPDWREHYNAGYETIPSDTNLASTYLSEDTRNILNALVGRTTSGGSSPEQSQRPAERAGGTDGTFPLEQLATAPNSVPGERGNRSVGIPNEPPMAPPARPLAAPSTTAKDYYSHSKEQMLLTKPSLVYSGKWSQSPTGKRGDDSQLPSNYKMDVQGAHQRRVTFDDVPVVDAGAATNTNDDEDGADRLLSSAMAGMSSASSRLASQVASMVGQVPMSTNVATASPKNEDSLHLFRKISGSMTDHHKEATTRSFQKYQIPAGVQRRLDEDFERRRTTFIVDRR